MAGLCVMERAWLEKRTQLAEQERQQKQGM